MRKQDEGRVLQSGIDRLNQTVDLADMRRSRKRKKVTIIKKRRMADGSLEVSKEHLYDMTVKQAMESVKNQHKKEFFLKADCLTTN